MPVELHVDGRAVTVDDDGLTLLDVLRDGLGLRSVKDGCSPQGQCGCCTVLVDGSPRVACVTPVRRLQGRAVTTVEGLAPGEAARWADVFCATGASQCGFCTPGIIMRLAAESTKPSPRPDQALLAHLCRCTGWLPILDAFAAATATDGPDPAAPSRGAGRDLGAAARRAALEGHTAQQVGRHVSLGGGGFADDRAPSGALVAVRDAAGGWAVGETVAEARRAAGKVQGRRSTMAATAPLPIPSGTWDRVLQTSWIDPAYVETDAAWCEPGGVPVGPLTNGGAFGGKVLAPVAGAARELANRHGRPVRVLWSREDAVRYGAKRPPVSAGIDVARGRIAIAVARTAGIVERLRLGLDAASSGLDVAITEVDLAGPPTSCDPRGAGWAEGCALRAAALDRVDTVSQPAGGRAEVHVDAPAGRITVHVQPGDVLDEVVLRSYCIGAVHMGLSWVTSERLAVAGDGTVADLTVRSLGVLRAVDMASLTVEIVVQDDGGPPQPVSDAVFAATASAVWAAQGWPPSWPSGRPLR
jgi:aerobic-type carbon monoxide dehydrogenase small subunit (CoxS/CutS family)